ncbi:MAG: NAD(P)-dependent oxidoreductase [Polyangiaceae bacterium]
MEEAELLGVLRRGLSAEELPREAAAALAAGSSRRALSDGEALFREGEPASFLFFVESGALSVRKRSEDGPEVELREMGAGEVGGVTSMFVDKARSATLIARGPSAVIAISRDALRAALARHASLSGALLAHLAAKVRTKTAQVATLLARSGRDPRKIVAFFDAKPYERAAFEPRWPSLFCAEYIDARLGPATVALARGYPVVCAFVNDELSAEVLEELAGFGTRLLAMRCAGYNNVDLGAAARHGIEIVRVPAYSPHAVAEHAMALILALNRKVHRAYGRVREGNFSLNGLVGFDLFGRTAGLVGTGRIGACLARILHGCGMTVLAHDRREDPELVRAAGVRFVRLEELLSASDIVSLHVPLTKDTHHMIDSGSLARMKRGAMLINTSRGGLIDTAALIEALKTGQLGAAGLDVYEEESEYFFRDRSDRAIDDDVLARLIGFPNVLVTSHQGFLTSDALDNIAGTTIANIDAFLAGKRGEELPNRVG